MLDFGRSDDPRVQAQLDRLSRLSVPDGRLSLDTITALMDRLGNPHRALPPVFHVAGTNGKGSVCAFLRAMLEADGKRVHVTTSPHLVRYNERIRLAGKLIEDAYLAAVLAEVLDAGADLRPSFFEVTIAAAFHAFSRTPADACVVEVGLGGRFDATNVLEPDAVVASGIAALGIDHERFLLAPETGVPTEPMARIAFEKAGIAKPGVPLVTMGERYPPGAQAAIENVAQGIDAPVSHYPVDWNIRAEADRLRYTDRFTGREHDLPRPAIAGWHQTLNAGLAIAMLRAQNVIALSWNSVADGLQRARWPARLERMGPGPLTALCAGRTVMIDGGHNPSAGQAIANAIDGPVHLVIGMLANKNPAAIVAPLSDRLKTLTVVPVPGHDSHDLAAFERNAREAPDLETAMRAVPDDGATILIAGSLYLAGEALRLNDELPD